MDAWRQDKPTFFEFLTGIEIGATSAITKALE